jgi:putative transposase
MPFFRTFYHFVWATKNRYPLITEQNQHLIERSIRASCESLHTKIYALGHVSDHIHLAVSLPPSLSCSKFAQQIKGASSHLVNHTPDDRQPTRDRFEWQTEYGVLTFGDRSLEDIVDYVDNQAMHHAAGTLRPLFELTEREWQRPTN